MRLKPPLFLLLLVLLAPACAVYDGVAYFHASGEVLNLKIDKHLKSRMSYVEASGPEGLFCSGALRTVHPAGLLQWSCKGEDGRLSLACNDGRHLMGLWSAATCSSGQGLGGDQYGNTFVLAYGDKREAMLLKVGAGPGEPRQAFAGAGAISPLYTALLRHDADEAPVFYSPREAAPDAARSMRGGGGSGFFSSAEGHIVTSASALAGAARLSVYLPDERRELPAQLVSIDQEKDIAVLKISAAGKVGGAVRVYAQKNPPKAGTRHYREDIRR